MIRPLLLASAVLCLGMTACMDMPTDKTLSADNWCISGGPIYTAIDSRPNVEAVAVKNGEIVYAGAVNNDWCDANTPKNRRVVDLKGAAMYPGLTDGHGHLIGIGLREMTLNLEGTKSVKELPRYFGAVRRSCGRR